MNKEEINQFADHLVQEFMENNLGGFIVLVSAKGTSFVTILPNWGILQLNKDKQLILQSKEEESGRDFLAKAEKTIYFLESIKQGCINATEFATRSIDSLARLFTEAAVELGVAQTDPEKTTLH